MNWNPSYSPVWQWLRNHAGVALIAALADPSFVASVSGPYAPQVTGVIAALTAVGVLGAQYGKPLVK